MLNSTELHERILLHVIPAHIIVPYQSKLSTQTKSASKRFSVKIGESSQLATLPNIEYKHCLNTKYVKNKQEVKLKIMYLFNISI